MARKISSLDDPKDRKFMEQLYLKYDRLILAMAEKYVDDPDDRKDVMQSVAENLIKHLPTIKGLPDKAVAAYIAYAVRNTAINYYKATERRKKRFVSLDDEEVARQVNREFQDTSVEELILFKSRISQLKEIWHELLEEDQILLEGKYIWEFSDKELAEDFGCKPDSIRMKLTRARRRALQYLSEKEEV